MLRLVTTNNVDVFRYLANPAFERLRLDHHVAPSYDAALTAVRDRKPDIALLDVELAGGSGFDLCETIKNDPDLASTHVVLLLTSLLRRADLERLSGSRADDVLALPVHSDDFYHHIAQVAGLPIRRERRVGVALDLILAGHASLRGTVTDLSAHGMGVAVAEPIEEGATVIARIDHDGRTWPDVTARVEWSRPSAEGIADGHVAGLSLVSPIPVETQMLLEELSLFSAARSRDEGGRGDALTIAIHGDFNERTDLSTLSARLENEPTIDFDMADVRYISSAGVRTWCQFLDRLGDKTYSFRHCSEAFAAQAAMVPMVLGHGQVVSLEAPYHCEQCDREEVRLLEVKAIARDAERVHPPRLRCATCGGPLEFDDIPERYFAFLRDPE